MKIKNLLISNMLFASILFGQTNSDEAVVGNLSYLEIHPGKEASFEKAVSAHVKKYHGVDQWSQWGGKVVNGKRGGQYVVGSSGHTWTDYAERKTSKAHNDEWSAIVQRHVKGTSGSTFYVKDNEASYNDRYAPMWVTNIYYTKPGKLQTMQSILRKAAKVREKTKSDFSRGIYYNVSGGDQDGLIYEVSRMDDLSDMEGESPSIMDQWLKVHGQKDWDSMTDSWWGSFSKSETEVVQRIPGMNTPQE
ncbi:MAG: hypothetical protein VYB52_03580 [Candidatus Neomarinimicrobiota bacterium]|jgi:hypothetical protein|nr:hypothetical protein [Candidatus Neomarinimicrobiota bacterium]MEC7871735.1 hypothetical protein [Candidatus Neomarinimicrobiota bacterium]MEC9006691.1 hypothetical protein [Candidatus Neomarinimicrobiota bacterium]MED5433910.1 hypothetical protein [Candidatus Neomarinimicrobiota bacterium]|tara:strand:- start:234 stop:977 length:744 start_codon:yes stop_codon:yes gene_type:complete